MEVELRSLYLRRKKMPSQRIKMIAIELLFYHGSKSEPRLGHDSGQTKEAYTLLVEQGLIEMYAHHWPFAPKYRVTESGDAYIESLTKIPFPIINYMAPSSIAVTTA
jgi:hypothetical protein